MFEIYNYKKTHHFQISKAALKNCKNDIFKTVISAFKNKFSK